MSRKRLLTLMLVSILAGILIMAVAASSVSAFATTPEIVGQENITKALESAAKPIEGKIIRVDIPDGKGGYTTLQAGKEKTTWTYKMKNALW